MRNKADKRLWTLSIVGCVIVVLTVLFVSIKVETNNVKNRIHSTIEYIRDQYSMYNSFNDAVEAKSLVRMVEKVQQTARNFKADDQALEKEHLKQYAGEQKLTGIIVLNDKDQQIAQYHMGSRFQKVMDYVMEKETLRDVKKYPQKSYMARIDLKNGGYIDLASYGRIDAKGTIIGYQYIKAEYAKNSELTIKNVLAGYKQENDGTIVITNGNDIIASNDKKLINTKAQNNPVVNEIRKSVKSGQFAVIQNGIKRYFTSLDKGRNYYIYMYAEDKDLVKTLMSNIGIALILYGIFVTILMTIKAKSNQQYELIQKQREEEYKKELEKSAREAKKANIAKTEFLQRMSHDIRTPINGIRGMVEVGDYYKDNLVKQAECRKKIWEASGFLLELINEVLDMSKLESDEVVLEEIPFNLSNISKEIFVVIEQIAAEENIRIVWEKEEITHWNLIGSPGYVKRIMMNILSNAVKYNKENGYIYISCQEFTSEQEGRVTIEFICRDTGIGMTKDFQKRLFEPFAQEHTGSRTKFSGTGLGMPITKKLIEKMGGTITFESKKGEGTTFVIRIPFKIDQDADQREEQEAISEKSIKDLKILLVEDNELNMEIAEFVIQNEGASVTKAWNGQEAVEIFKKSRPDEFDVILMDIMMPIKNGYEAAKMIRALDRDDAKTVPIIAMTANAFTEDRLKSKESGMNEHIAKPIDAKLLVKVISEFVENKEEDS